MSFALPVVDFESIGISSYAISNFTDAIAAYLHNPITDVPIFGVFLDGHLILEIALVVIIGVLMSQKSYKPDNSPLTEPEIDQLCKEWEPEPLHPALPPEAIGYKAPVLERAAEPVTVVNGHEVLNLTSTSALNLIRNPKVIEAASETLNKYGVGSCGPRGFYGTIDVHVDLEEKISSFMGVDDCILYSYGLATPSSTIPAFCKRGDLIIADEGVNWSIQNGLSLSRSTVRYFKHNDMADLERRLKEVLEADKRSKKVLNRRIIVAEGIYQNSGQMVPLPEIVALKEKYRFRLVLDESLTFGVLGRTGHGLSEHFGVDRKKIEIITVGMGNALASEGGFCCGGAHMVDHQRLSGLGYIFSASLPPFLASAAIASLDQIEGQPELRVKLQKNIATFRKAASNISALKLNSDPQSPLCIFTLSQSRGSIQKDIIALQLVVNKILEEESVLISVTRRSPLDKCKLPVGIRVAVSSGHSEKQLVNAANSLAKVAKALL